MLTLMLWCLLVAASRADDYYEMTMTDKSPEIDIAKGEKKE